MQENDVFELTSKAATLIYRFEQRCEAAEQQLHKLAQELNNVTRQLPAVVKQSADSALENLPSQVIGNVKEGLERPVADYQRRLDNAGSKVGEGARSMAEQLRRMEQLHRMLMWKVTGVTIASLTLLLAGGIWLSLHYAGVIRDNQVEAETLKAYNVADVVTCDGGLCANVDIKGKRYGPKGEYFSVKPR